MRTKRILTLALAVLLGTSGLMACDKGIEDTPVDAPSEGTVSDYEAATKPTADTTEEKADETPTYEMYSIGAFSEGLAPISTNAGYGYIDMNGQIVIAPSYEEASEFDTLALVRYQDTLQYINRNGETVYVHNGTKENLGECKNGFFWATTIEETLSGNIPTITYYDQNGQIAFSIEGASEAIQQIPDHNLNGWNIVDISMSSFNEYGYAIVKINGKNKFIDTTGQIVSIDSFGIDNSDYSVKKQQDQLVVISGSAYFLDYTNQLSVYLGRDSYYAYQLPVSPLCQNYYATYYRSTYSKQYTAIHYCGEILLDFNSISELGGATIKAVSISEVNHELYLILYAVSADGIFFSIISDMAGNFITTPTKQYALGHKTLSLKDGAYCYEDFEAYAFHGDLCIARDTETGLYGYIDIQGNWVIPPQYNEATDFHVYGDNAVAVVNNNTIINRNGDVIFTIAE